MQTVLGQRFIMLINVLTTTCPERSERAVNVFFLVPAKLFRDFLLKGYFGGRQLILKRQTSHTIVKNSRLNTITLTCSQHTQWYKDRRIQEGRDCSFNISSHVIGHIFGKITNDSVIIIRECAPLT